jgi:isopenicillin-N N-acyltransferase like protein
MFGAWGDALADPTSLLTMRALDWNMDGPFRNFAQLTVYHAAPNSLENSFVNIGWTGWIGSLSGVSEAQMSIHEIGVSKPDNTFGEESREGVPFTYVLRDILQWDQTQLDGVSRLASSHRTCDLILGVGGGKERRFNSVQYSASVCNIMDDKNLKPVATWHEPIDNVVYHGMDWMCPGYNSALHDQLAKHHGNLTAEIAVSDVMSIVQTGDLHVWVADLVNMKLWTAHARKDGAAGPDNAYQRAFIYLDLNALFNTPAPSS